MISKRIIVLVTDEQHAAVKEKAAGANLSVANYVRKCLKLPPERQGQRKDKKHLGGPPESAAETGRKAKVK